MGRARVDIGGSDRVADLVNRLNATFDKTEQKLKDIARQSKRTQEEVEKNTNQNHESAKRWEEALKRVQSGWQKFTAILHGVRAAADAARRAIDWLNQESESGARTIQRDFFELGRLGQLPGGGQLREQAVQLLGTGAFDTPGQAARFMFDLNSASQGRQAALLARARFSGLIEQPGLFGEQVTGLQQAFKNASFRDLASQAMEAGVVARADVSKVMQMTAKGSAQIGNLNIGPAGAFAATAILSRTFGENAGEAVTAFFRAAGKGNVQGKNVSEIVGNIARQGEGVLGGDSLAISGFRILNNNLADLTSAMQTIRSAPSRDVFMERIRANERDPLLQGEISRRAAAGQRMEREIRSAGRAQRAEIMQEQIGGGALGAAREFGSAGLATAASFTLPGGGVTQSVFSPMLGADVPEAHSAAMGANTPQEIMAQQLQVLRSMDAKLGQRQAPAPTPER